MVTEFTGPCHHLFGLVGSKLDLGGCCLMIGAWIFTKHPNMSTIRLSFVHRCTFFASDLNRISFVFIIDFLCFFVACRCFCSSGRPVVWLVCWFGWLKVVYLSDCFCFSVLAFWIKWKKRSCKQLAVQIPQTHALTICIEQKTTLSCSEMKHCPSVEHIAPRLPTSTKYIEICIIVDDLVDLVMGSPTIQQPQWRLCCCLVRAFAHLAEHADMFSQE